MEMQFFENFPSGKSDDVDPGQVGAEANPVVAAIFRKIEIAGGAAESKGRTADIHRMAKHDIETVFLRQSFAQRLPGSAAVFRAADAKGLADRYPYLVTDGGHYPGAIRVLVVDSQRKSVIREPILATDVHPLFPSVGRPVNAAMVLLPEHIRIDSTGKHAMRIVAYFRPGVGQIGRDQALIANRPGLTAVLGLKDARTTYRDVVVVTIARINHDRMDNGVIPTGAKSPPGSVPR